MGRNAIVGWNATVGLLPYLGRDGIDTLGLNGMEPW